MAMRLITVLCSQAIPFNNQLGRKGIEEFTMDQQISHHLAQDAIPDVDALIPLQPEFIRQVFGSESHQSFIALQ